MVDNNNINETETALKSIPKEFLDSLKKIINNYKDSTKRVFLYIMGFGKRDVE